MAKKYDLYLRGFVGSDKFDDEYVDYILNKKRNDTVDVLINSLGGSVASALTIAASFKNHGNVNVHFVSMNASAATIASLGAKHISIDKNAMYLVHKCSSQFFNVGNFNADNLNELISELQSEKENLDKIDVNIASMYSQKCKKSVSELLALMQKGGWLSANEALSWGFVDEITDSEEKSPKMTQALASQFEDAGIPIPNIPFADATPIFQKFIDSVTAFFKREQNAKQYNIMPVESKFIAPILNKEIEAKDENITLSKEEFSRIEDAINNDRSKISDLNAQIESLNSQIVSLKTKIEDLEKSPADSSSQVVISNTQKSPYDDYCERVKKSNELFNLI